ncbi:MAG TPA: hypothetical protein VEV44_15290 [Pseudoneobacillus sp.]|nr:hypothetical protein [Pseudoneobacillus sp.]
MNLQDENEFSYCDCECECESSSDENCECECDCECNSYYPYSSEKMKRKSFRIPSVRLSLPNKAGSSKIPTNTPIKVKIPRANICRSIPHSKIRNLLCEPESMNRHTVENGTIKVCVLVLPGAQIGDSISTSRIPSRVKSDIQAANMIWKQQVNGRSHGVSFEIVSCVHLETPIQGVGKDLKHFPWHDDIAYRLMEMGRKICPYAHVYIFYMNGDHIGPLHSNGSHTDAITFRDAPIVIMSNGASSRNYILAHELGHIMYLHNLYGNKYDPNPFPGDPDHNAIPHNLMYPTSDYWPSSPRKPTITSEQIRKALNTRFFYE